MMIKCENCSEPIEHHKASRCLDILVSNAMGGEISPMFPHIHPGKYSTNLDLAIKFAKFVCKGLIKNGKLYVEFYTLYNYADPVNLDRIYQVVGFKWHDTQSLKEDPKSVSSRGFTAVSICIAGLKTLEKMKGGNNDQM